MTSSPVLNFLIGFGSALAIGAVARVLIGMRLNLFLVSADTMIRDQAVIPVTTEHKKSSFLKSLKQGNWREDVILTLMDYADHACTIRIGFHLWTRFYLVVRDENPHFTVDGERAEPAKRYPLRTGSRLRVGNRLFTVLVSPTQPPPESTKELYST